VTALVETPLPRIVTLTLSPAVDVATSVTRLVPFTKMRCAPAQRDPGGGGINVARVLKRLSMDVTAIYPAGGATGQVLETLVAGEGVHSIAIATSRDTREDLTIFDQTTREQFRLVFPGTPLDESEWRACLEAIATIAPEPGFVIVSGSVPTGVPPDFFDRLARACATHSRVMVDTSGPFLRAALDAGVYLIKPNLREFRELTGLTTTDGTALIDAGRRLFDRSRVEVIAISMGPHGALLVTRDRALRAQGLPVEAISVSGAGDSFLGAMVWSLAHDGNLETALRYGVAGGTAALLNPGTDLCRTEDVHRLAATVIVTPVVYDHG
jgi:6-phosphofructokinase 2